MRRSQVIISVALTALLVVAIALVVVASGGGDDEEPAANPVPSNELEAPAGGAPPPSVGGLQLPPGIAECLADQGFDIDPSNLHSVPPDLLQACFGALHQGGGVP